MAYLEPISQEWLIAKRREIHNSCLAGTWLV